jgi:hypothetical protein
VPACSSTASITQHLPNFPFYSLTFLPAGVDRPVAYNENWSHLIGIRIVSVCHDGFTYGCVRAKK